MNELEKQKIILRALIVYWDCNACEALGWKAECQKNGNKNRLTKENQDRIFSVFQKREEVQYFSRLVSIDDILQNDSNLSVSSYVEQEDTREVIDIKAVNATLQTLIAEGNELNRKIDAIVKELGEV